MTLDSTQTNQEMRRIWAQVLWRISQYLLLNPMYTLMVVAQQEFYAFYRVTGKQANSFFFLLPILTAVFQADFINRAEAYLGSRWEDTQLSSTSRLPLTSLPSLADHDWVLLAARSVEPEKPRGGWNCLYFSHICISAPSVTVRQGHHNGLLWKAWLALLSVGWVLHIMETPRQK